MNPVTICCVTYNQAQWLGQALESFLAQQTQFAFGILVYDDASSDATAEVVRRFTESHPGRIEYVRAKRNGYSETGIQYVCRDVYPLIRSEYAAFCDGDDYWSDPLKLQKQYDFMRSHPACGACFGRVKRYDQQRGEFIGTQGAAVGSFEQLLEECTITWQTFFVRNSLLQEYIREVKPHVAHREWPVQDYPFELYVSRRAAIRFLPEELAVFRIYRNSVTHPDDPRRRARHAAGILSIVEYFSQGIDTPRIREIKAKYTSYFMGALLGDAGVRKIRKRLCVFVRAGGRYRVDAVVLAAASCVLWWPYAVRGIYYLKNKIMPVKWRAVRS